MKALKYAFVAIAIVIGGVWGLFEYGYPYGVRTCWLPCTMNALMVYAKDHNGWYPAGTNTWEALRLLYPELIGNPELLAGISGDRKEAKRRLETGGILDSNVSSWIYFPGFSLDDQTVAIIWERTEGLRFNGSRSSGHAVGFANGGHAQIPRERWSTFVQEQEKLRREVIAKRATNGVIRNP